MLTALIVIVYLVLAWRVGVFLKGDGDVADN